VASIRKYRTGRGQIRYEVRWRDGSGRGRSQAFHAHADAERRRVDVERRKQLGALYEAPPTLFGEFLDHWLARYEQRVRPSSYARAVSALRSYRGFAGLHLHEVRAGEVEDAVMRVARKAPRQAQIGLALLKQVIEDARDRGQRVDSAIARIKPPKHDEREPRFLAWAEVEALASLCSEGRLVVFAALTGLRQGEVFALREARCELGDPAVVVDAGSYQGQLVPTKTRRGRRRVYLSGLAVEVLREQLRERTTNDLGLVFPSPQGVVWRADNFMSRVFRPAARRAGLDGLTFHDLRHTYASLMILGGADPLVVAEQLGHSDARLVLQRYGHLYPGASRRAVEALDQITSSVGQVWDAADALTESAAEIPLVDEWSVPGSNRRPSACKADALPTELTPRACRSVGEVRRMAGL
jgi:integrase